MEMSEVLSVLMQPSVAGKARRLKQAKEEAQAEIEKFRLEREQQYKQYEAKVGFNLAIFID